MSKKKKIIIVILVVLILLAAAGGITFYMLKKDKEPSIKKVSNEDTIKEFNYSIKKSDSKVKKTKFKELKKILSEDDIDYDSYAIKLAEIFAVDVYDLDSKVNKYDVGGLEYVLDEKKEDFKLTLQDTLYSNIKDNTDNDRKQQLPIVTDATGKKEENVSYKYNDEEFDAYNIKIKIDYEKDLGYDKDISMKVIKKENKLYIVTVEPN